MLDPTGNDGSVRQSASGRYLRNLQCTRRVRSSLAWLIAVAALLPGTADAQPAGRRDSSAGSTAATEQAATPRPFVPAELTVPEGWQVQLAASPPLVTHPMMACFGDQGRLFVCHSAGLNLSAEELEDQLPNSILMLEDVNGDGRFDRQTVFADRMTFPMGAAWWKGSLYVASPPYIWKLEDRDGDGKAERRTVLVRQFGYTGNAASIHGCFLGLNGRLYWCDGYHGHQLSDAAGKVVGKREASYLFSSRPDGSDVRIHCGGGMDNPVEVDFMPTGEMLGTVNILYSRPRDDCLVHWLYGGAYPHRERALDEMRVTGEVLGPAHSFGHVAVSGMLRYRYRLPDPTWHDNVFATYFNSGKVIRLEMHRSGSSWSAVEREFLHAVGRDFHPTDVVEDADGSLLVVDTGGWFYRGCPTSQFAKPDVLGAIYRLVPPQPARGDVRGRQIGWGRLSPRDLCLNLVDPRPAVAERALQAVADRWPDVLPEARRWARSSRTDIDLDQRRSRMLGRLLWAAARHHAQSTSPLPEVADLVRGALTDRSADVRLIACHVLSEWPQPAAGPRLAELLADRSAAVRRQAAVALGRVGERSAAPALLQALARPADRSTEHALIYALLEIGDCDALRAGLTAPSPSARRGALIAVEQLPGAVVAADDVARFLDDDDGQLRRAAIWVFGRHPDWAPSALSVVRQWVLTSNKWQQRLSETQELLSRFIGQPAAADLIAEMLRLPADDQRLGVALKAIAAGSNVPMPASWAEPLVRCVRQGETDVALAAVEAAGALAGGKLDAALLAVGNDARRSRMLRVAAYEAAAHRRGVMGEAHFQLLLKTIDDADSVQATDDAAQALAAARLTPDQLQQLLPLMEEAGPVVLSRLIKPFERGGDAELRAALLETLATARSFSLLATTEFSDVIKRFPAPLLLRANQLLDQLKQRDQQQLQRLDQLVAKLDQGDPQRGKRVFETEKAKCSTCHRVGPQGANIGPELTTIGANRSRRDLLESIVFPSASIVRQYEPYTLITVQGRVLDGLVARETVDAVYLQQATGDPLMVRRADIDELVPATVSIMPNGLGEALTESELIDVVAYLASCMQTTSLSSAHPR